VKKITLAIPEDMRPHAKHHAHEDRSEGSKRERKVKDFCF